MRNIVKYGWQQWMLIACLALFGAWVNSLIDPVKPVAISCDPQSLASDEICLRTVLEDWRNDCIWIDARRRVDWQKDGLPGSLLLTTADGESFDLLLEQAFPVLAAKNKRVVVYCSDAGCGTSREVAKRLREYQLVSDVRALHGGWKALSQAGLIDNRKPGER